MPSFFTEEDNASIGRPISLAEFGEVLKEMAKDKSLGSNGWTVEFYLLFFDLLGLKIVRLVEESRLSGKVSRGLNTIVLTLIPKTSDPTSFQDFRLILVCNLLYYLQCNC